HKPRGGAPLPHPAAPLPAGTALTVTGTTTLNNSNVTIGGSSAVVFAGPVLLAGVNNTLAVTNTAPTIITGTVGDNPAGPARTFTKTGGGTLTLTRANTYTPQTNIPGRVVNRHNNTPP